MEKNYETQTDVCVRQHFPPLTVYLMIFMHKVNTYMHKHTMKNDCPYVGCHNIIIISHRFNAINTTKIARFIEQYDGERSNDNDVGRLR